MKLSILPASKRWFFLLLLVFISALALRLYALGDRDLWYDEVNIFYVSEDDDAMKRVFETDVPYMPPLFYFLIHFWIKVFGISESSLRMPSALFGFLCVPFIYMLGKRLFNRRIALYAALLMAFSPFQIWYAQEARPYTLITLLGILSTFSLLSITDKGGWRHWTVFILASLCGLYSNFFYALLFIPQSLYLLIRFRRQALHPSRFIPYSLLILLLLPWVFKMYARLGIVMMGYWIPVPSIKSLLITIANFNLGYNVDKGLYFLSLVLSFVILARSLSWLRQEGRRRSGFMVCSVLFLSPILLFYLTSILVVPLYVPRGLIAASPFYYLLLAVGIDSINRKLVRYALIGSFSLMLVLGNVGYFKDKMPAPMEYHLGVFLKKPFRPMAEFIAERFREGDAIAATNLNPPYAPSIFYYTWFQYNLPTRCYTLVYSGMANETIAKNLAKIDPCKTCLFLGDINQIEFRRIWVFSTDGGPRTGGLDRNSQAVKDYLDSTLKLEYRGNFDGMWLSLYSK